MINRLELPFNPDVLPAEGVLAPAHLRLLEQLFTVNAKLVVTSSIDESIPRSLRASDALTGIPAIRQPMVIGVLAGAQSGNLVAVGFRRKEDLGDFISANPALQGALVTVWNGQYLIWLASDFMARNIEEPEIIWVAEGVIPLCWLEKAGDLEQVYQPGKPTQVSYHHVIWPESVSGIFRLELLRSLYGHPYISSKRKTSLNLSLWAAWSLDRLKLVYDARIDAFLRIGKADERIETLGMSATTEIVINFLQRCAALDGKNFPQTEMRPSRIRELIALMKTMSVLPAVREPDGLEEYLANGVRKMDGANLTSEELWQGYLAHFHGRPDVSLYPKCEFRRISRLRVRGMFGKTLVHSIVRGGHQRRGYNDLRLAQSEASPGNRDHNDSPMKQCPAPLSSKDAKGVTDAKDRSDGVTGTGVAGTCVSNSTL
jgi:hypothetical protein